MWQEQAGLDRAWATVPFVVASSLDMTLMPESIWRQRTLLSCGHVESQGGVWREGLGAVEVTVRRALGRTDPHSPS